MDLQVQVDPTESFDGIKDSKLVAATGLIPYFFAEASTVRPKTAKEAFDVVMECYGFGMGQDGSGWGTVDDKGMYISQYDEDPALAPLIEVQIAEGITGYVYQYAITAVVGPDGTFIARCD